MDAEKYYTSTTLNDVKLKFQAKVEPKLLIWVTMPLKGIIRAYIHRNKIVVDAETYLNVCIQKRLILFIEWYRTDDSVLFWADLDSMHYAREV